MSAHLEQLEKWELLMDRQALGESLSADEQAFCERFSAAHPECTVEQALYEQLADMHTTPSDSRELVDAVLKRMELEDAQGPVALQSPSVSPLRRVPMRIALVAASGVLAAAAAFALYARPKPHEDSDLRMAQRSAPTRAELVYASGNVSVSNTPATVGRTLLTEGSVIATGDGAACVFIDPDINVCLSAQSRLRLSSIQQNARRLDLLEGTASTRLATQPEGMSLSIVADGIASTAIGTAFSVERGENGRAVVTTVLNGKVRVGPLGHQGAEQIVTAHERATNVTGAQQVAGALTSVSRSEEAPSWAILSPTALWHDPISGTLHVHGDPVDAEAMLDDQPIGIAPLSSLIPVGSHHLVVRSHGVVLLERDLHVGAGETQDVAYTNLNMNVAAASKLDEAAALAKADALKNASAAREHSAQNAKALRDGERVSVTAAQIETPAAKSAADWLSEARRSLREGRFADAEAAYQAVETQFPTSEEAQIVLVSLGQLQLGQLKEPTRALESVERYLVRGGSLSEEARITRIRALRALHRDNDEASAIEEFLAAHPRSFEASGLRARLSTLRGPQ